MKVLEYSPTRLAVQSKSTWMQWGLAGGLMLLGIGALTQSFLFDGRSCSVCVAASLNVAKETSQLGSIFFGAGFLLLAICCQTKTLVLDQTLSQVSLKHDRFLSSRTVTYPLRQVTGAEVVSRGKGVHVAWLRLWLEKGDRLRGAPLSITVPVAACSASKGKLGYIESQIYSLLDASGQTHRTSAFAGWIAEQTSQQLTIRKPQSFAQPAASIIYVIDKHADLLTIRGYPNHTKLNQDFPLSQILAIQLEETYAPDDHDATHRIRLSLASGERFFISEERYARVGLKTVAYWLAQFLQMELQIIPFLTDSSDNWDWLQS